MPIMKKYTRMTFLSIIFFSLTIVPQVATKAHIQTERVQTKQKKESIWAYNLFSRVKREKRRSKLEFEMVFPRPDKTVSTEKIILKTRDGLKRHGTLTLRKNARGNVVLCHPAAYDQEFMIPFEKNVFMDYNCLRFDFRRHGAERKNHSSTLGKREIWEVEAAVETFKNHEKTKDLPIYGFGVSMGASTLIEAESKKHQFNALILQAAFESLKEQIKRSFYFFGEVPLMKHMIFCEPTRLYAKIKYKVRLCEVSPIESIKKIDIPIFLIHAQNDPIVSIEAFEQLKKAGKNCVAKTWEPAIGRHTELFKTLPLLFSQKCNLFLNE